MIRHVLALTLLATPALANPFSGRPDAQAFMVASFRVCGRHVVPLDTANIVAHALAADENVPLYTAAVMLRFRGARAAQPFIDAGAEDLLCARAGAIVRLMQKEGLLP